MILCFRSTIFHTFTSFRQILFMTLKELDKATTSLHPSEKMPVLFLGHGSPMNAIENNEFVHGFKKLSKELPRPHAILCISAHWETKGTFVTAMQQPRTIHDFGGFPEALYQVQYPAPGSPQLARDTKDLVTKTNVGLDEHQWGLDHGAWTVLKHLYPAAEVPIIEMSIDHYQTPLYHYELARQLKPLRERGVLIVGSGNMVHNLGLISWQHINEQYGFDWALEASETMKQFILNDDHLSLINYQKMGSSFKLAIPSPEHYLPLLYALALKDENEKINLFNDKPLAGSITMTSLKIA